MPKRLQDNLNSQYIASANRLMPKKARRRVVAYVESYDDIYFWRNVLQEFETESLYFEVMLPSRTSLGRGKKMVLMNQLGKGLGEYMIACVDADYDWLMQGCTEVSRMVCENPYILHTYVYAIENYQCYAPALHTVCVMSTLNDRQVIDLEAFMKEFSSLIWPLFVWSVWCYRHEKQQIFGIMEFSDTVAFRDINVHHPEYTLDYVRNRVNHKINWLQHTFPQGRSSYAPLRQELLDMGITPETCYLYMRGHTLLENVTMPLIGPICTLLRKEREHEITRLGGHSQHTQNELACYEHSQCAVDVMLRKSDGFKNSPPYQWLREDIMRLIGEDGLQK